MTALSAKAATESPATSAGTSRVAVASAAVVAFAGLVALAGWLTQSSAIRALGLDGGALNPVTAICFVALGGALVCTAVRGDSPLARRASIALALLVGVIATARVAGLALGEEVSIDTVLFADPLARLSGVGVTRMDGGTAVMLAMVAVALLLFLERSRYAILVAHLLVVTAVVGQQLLLASRIRSVGWAASMLSDQVSLLVLLAISLLSLSLLSMSRQQGLLGLLSQPGPARTMTRILLPAAYLVPVTVDLMILQQRRSGILTGDSADTLVVVLVMILMLVLVAAVAYEVQEHHLERVAMEAELRDNEERFRLIAENSTDVVSLLDASGRVTYVSPSCERLVGFQPEELLRMEAMALIHPEDVPRMERHASQLLRGEPVAPIQVRMLHKTGRHVWLDMMWRVVIGKDGEVTGLQVSSRDITERKQYESMLEEAQRVLKRQQRELEDVNGKLKAMASTDALTGIRNRRAFEERLEQEISRAHRYGHAVSLLLLDVDHFKSFNDTFGHPKGDEVLRAVGRLLTRAVRNTDLVARYGGEEFVVVLPSTELPEAQQLAERLRAAVAEATWDDRPITVSIGVATFSARVSTAEELIDEADRGLYRAKQEGRNRVAKAEEALS